MRLFGSPPSNEGKFTYNGDGAGLLSVPGRPTADVLAVGADGHCLNMFSLVYHFPFSFALSRGVGRYRLKYYRKGPLNPIHPNEFRKNISKGFLSY